jgi:hypothetical protein
MDAHTQKKKKKKKKLTRDLHSLLVNKITQRFGDESSQPKGCRCKIIIIIATTTFTTFIAQYETVKLDQVIRGNFGSFRSEHGNGSIKEQGKPILMGDIMNLYVCILMGV